MSKLSREETIDLLRAMVDRLEGDPDSFMEEGKFRSSHVIDALDDEATDRVNGVAHEFVFDALKTLGEAGVVDIQIHKKFADEWADALKSAWLHNTETQVDGAAAVVKILDEGPAGTPTALRLSLFEPCENAECRACYAIVRQWLTDAECAELMQPQEEEHTSRVVERVVDADTFFEMVAAAMGHKPPPPEEMN